MFIHAGVIQWVIYAILQWYIIASVEENAGFVRTLLIYLTCSVYGTLLSSTVVPYDVGVGPGAGIFGVFGVQLVEDSF